MYLPYKQWIVSFKQNYRVMIERHRKLVNDLQKHLEIERILVSQACNDLIEVNKNI